MKRFLIVCLLSIGCSGSDSPTDLRNSDVCYEFTGLLDGFHSAIDRVYWDQADDESLETTDEIWDAVIVEYTYGLEDYRARGDSALVRRSECFLHLIRMRKEEARSDAP